MNHIRSKFLARGFDAQEYQRSIHRHQDEATRKKLCCVHAFAAGQEFAALSKELRIHEQSSRSYIAIYIRGGFAELCAAIQRSPFGSADC